ncbi:ferric-dicitrate binding protein FerR (iron transport regulator) [Pedobacter sp. AK017]|uniref:FecR family protein n=1 Tax=Pedobacter sp. AK017 TaxID=2723073 RepID=UPI00160CBED3|nr:FecR domain-containing protein [Pedobacter sp. AK017]MBB5438320.1 ferric-dicitrate binding protein FerR (iron transport regulator) [Pedobacter sp. AK017]
MDKQREELTLLFKRYLANECSEEEEQVFLELLRSGEHEVFFKDLIDSELKQQPDPQFKDLPQVKEDLAQTKRQILLQINAGKIHQHPAKKRLWFKIAAVLLLFAGAIFFKVHLDTQNLPADVAPGGNKAILTLADGSEIILDQVGKGNLARQAGVQVVKTTNGQLVYTVKESYNSDKGIAGNLTNTISTPRGGQYQVNLPDGTRVWLNAASSLRFPLSFAKLNERKVELKGEAYFEVEKDATKPFIVRSDRQTVQVLGTHFNINSYEDEPDTKTTLLEGAVKVTALSGAKSEQAFLKPGQQSRISSGSKPINVMRVDPMAEIAWKNGQFFFENESIENIMKQISRWYDVEVVYEDDVAGKTVWGSVTRYANVSKVLSILELTGEIHFKVEGRRIIVHK